MPDPEDIEVPDFRIRPRHAQYRDGLANGTRDIRRVPDYTPWDNNPMSLDKLRRVDSDNERQWFIHNNTVPDISINPNREDDAVRIKFFGCNSIYITDGTTQLLIDPFFTRPEVNARTAEGLSQPIHSKPRIVEATLDHAQIQSVDAILMTHAHWDHALDIAEVWRALHPPDSDCPKIYGCDSIYQIARGGAQNGVVPDSYIQHPVRNQIFNIGNFKVCFIPGRHTQFPKDEVHEALDGEISETVPAEECGTASADSYKEGIMSDILIEHRHGLILNKGSANFEPELLDRLLTRYSSRNTTDYNRFIDVIILSCAGFNTLGWWSREAFAAPQHITREDHRVYNHFWDHVISPTKPYLLLFSHWDEFLKGRENCLDRDPKWMFRAYECKDLFEGELRGRRIHTDRRVRNQGRAGIENFRQYKTRFIPFWEEITILPIHSLDGVVRRPSAFQLPDGSLIDL